MLSLGVPKRPELSMRTAASSAAQGGPQSVLSGGAATAAFPQSKLQTGQSPQHSVTGSASGTTYKCRRSQSPSPSSHSQAGTGGRQQHFPTPGPGSGGSKSKQSTSCPPCCIRCSDSSRRNALSAQWLPKRRGLGTLGRVVGGDFLFTAALLGMGLPLLPINPLAEGGLKSTLFSLPLEHREEEAPAPQQQWGAWL